MSFSEMKVFSGCCPGWSDFLLASSAASFRFALGPPPVSTAWMAAWMRSSLRSAKSAGVRI